MPAATGDGRDTASIQCSDNLVNAIVNALHAPVERQAYLVPERFLAAR